MAQVIVSRQVVDDKNRLSWELVEVDEKDLRENEIPYVDPSTQYE